MKQYTIKATIQFKNSLWIGIFERNDDEGYAVARQIFGAEPTDPELYEFVTTHFHALKFSKPTHQFQLIIKRKNFKRALREVREEMKKVTSRTKESLAQEVLRIEMEKNKKTRKTFSKTEKEAKKQQKFSLRQEKKKKKKRGH